MPKNAHASSSVLQTFLGYSNKYCISPFLTTCPSLKGEINLMAKSYICQKFCNGKERHHIAYSQAIYCGRNICIDLQNNSINIKK